MNARLSAAALAALMTFVAACGGDSRPDATPTATTPAPATVSPSPPGSPTATPPASPAATAEPTAPPGTFSYTIAAGDTLFSLARRYGTTVEVLKGINGIEDETSIPIGLVIFIPISEGTPTPAPAASPTPTATPSAGISTLVRNGPRSSNRVALTFDMGGRLDPAVEIMNFLVANRVRATIFPTGAALETQNSDLGRKAIAVAAANVDLFDIGNHSYSHPDFTTISSASIAEELSSAAAVIERLTGRDPRPWFRPPFGAYNEAVLRAVGASGYAYTVMWDVDTIDWRPESDGGPTADEIVAKVLANARGGSIVLMHLGGYNTLAALPRIVEGLRAAGFELATVAELSSD